jgi:hypothetical protein
MKTWNPRLLLGIGVVLFGVTAIWWGVGIAGGDMKYESELNKRLQGSDTLKDTLPDNIREVTPRSGSEVTPSDKTDINTSNTGGTTYSTRVDNSTNRKNYNTGDAADYTRDANNPNSMSTKYQYSGKTLHRPNKNDVMAATSTWSPASQKAINNMLYRYGDPDVVTEDMVIWKKTGPFLSSTVIREGVKNNFPNEHTGVLEQVIAYKVPVEKIDDLYRFNGGIIVDRAQGTLTVRGSTEEMNIAALNLVNDIITTNITSDDAQREYGNIANSSSIHSYTRGLEFTTYTLADTRDPGRKYEPQRASTR